MTSKQKLSELLKLIQITKTKEKLNQNINES